MENDIAIVGIGLRFPGDASSPEELWKVLERGESQWSEFPKDRLNIDGYYHPSSDRQGSISFRGAHFIKGNFASFDASFFSISAEDAKAIDPQQRILLEASYEALENAGIRKEDIDGSDAAVYVGSFVKDYEQVCLRDPDWQPQYAATGNGIAIMANRISHFFNLHGPSMTIDTGCSGSLVSVHLASQSLRAKETSLAIAAGAGMILTPNTMMPMTALNFLSPDGKCFTFDSRANGYGRGEGIGVVVMKRLSDAIRDNDTIRAVIRATKVNQDGHTTGRVVTICFIAAILIVKGITLPSKEAQVANINSVYESAGLDFSQTGYVECHGTGTKAGDWRELKAISESLCTVRDIDNPIVVGSIKPNIGHLEGAAGVAGLIKGVLTLEHAKIPPNINFEKPNPDIDFKEWKVKVPTELLDWPVCGLRRVSVNCFGFGGTNAHVIMDEAPRYLSARGLRGNHNSFEAITSSRRTSNTKASFEPQLFVFSSHDKLGVRRIMESHIPYLESRGEDDTAFLHNYAYTLGSRRSNLEWKHAVVAKSREDLIVKLQNIDESLVKRTSKNKQPNICFLFCGQGAQFAQMGKDLLPFEAFHDALEAGSRYMKNKLASEFDLLEEILKDEAETRISDSRISQPATTAIQMALVDLLDSFHVAPNYVIGHSSGEIAAAYASGALTKEEAWEVAYYRGLVASSLAIEHTRTQGSMMVVGLSVLDLDESYDDKTYPCEVACVNGPRSLTLSGRKENIEGAFRELSAKGIFCRILPVKVAYHSSDMLKIEKEYKSALRLINPRQHRKSVTMFSSVTGEEIDGHELNNKYWTLNLVSPVVFMSAISTMLQLPSDKSPDIIVELSPSSTLRSPVLDIITFFGFPTPPRYSTILDRKVHGAMSLLGTMAELWECGCKFSMEKVVTRGSYQIPLKPLADLPPYPWNHTRSYWHESHLGEATRFREFPRQDLIGAPTGDAISFQPRWRGFLRIAENPWIQDHQIQKTIIYPAAGMIAMALQGAYQATKGQENVLGYEIINMRIERAMIVPTTAHGLEMAMNFKSVSCTSVHSLQGAAFDFCIYSKQLNSSWEQNATGRIEVRYMRGQWKIAFQKHREEYELLKGSCLEPVVPRQLYELLDIVGMNYGSLFQNIIHIRKSKGACVTKIRIPDTRSKMPAKFEYDHLIHPATLDSMFQTPFAIESEPMVPSFIESIFVSAKVSSDINKEFDGYSTATRVGVRDASADISMAQSGWEQPSVIIRGLRFTGISGSSREGDGFLPNNRTLCTQVSWMEDITCSRTENVEDFVKRLAHKLPGLSILQVGGTSDTTQKIVSALTSPEGQRPWLSRYTLAEASPDDRIFDIASVFAGTAAEPFIEKRPVDGSEPLPDYDLILVCSRSEIDIAKLSSHLKRPGYIMENCPDGNPDLDETISHDYNEVDGKKVEIKLRVNRKNLAEDWLSVPDVAILLPDNPPSETQWLAGKLIMERQSSVQMRAMQLNEVLSDPSRLKNKIVISLLDFSAGSNAGASIYNWTETEFNAFHSVHQVVKGILWISRSAHMDPMNPKGAPVIALARTLMSEEPLKTFVTFDLSMSTPLNSSSVVQNVNKIFLQAFVSDQGSGPRELEYAERNGVICVPRLVPIGPLNDVVENGISSEITKVSFHSYPRHLKLHVSQPGLTDDSLVFTAGTRYAPQPGEVEVIFESAPLDFIDLETAMGKTLESEVGSEIRGRIGRIGRNVSGFMTGDLVSGLVTSGSVQSNVNIDSRFVSKWSSRLSFSHFVRAFHCFDKVGRLGPGKSVLIHAGASGVGMAAIIVAFALSAEVFVTVMGPNSDKQRAFLEESGVKKANIVHADSDLFTTVVCNRSGHGVDLVYNATQRHIEDNFKCVRRGGIVVQFSCRLPSPPPVHVLSSDVSLVNFDLQNMLKYDADYVAELVNELSRLVESSSDDLGNDLPLPEPIINIDINRIKEAFGLIEKNPFFGLVSITGGPDATPQVDMAIKKTIKPLHQALSGTDTYLLAGGLGGLGRSICELLVKNGARHIAFLSRTGTSSEASQRFFKDLCDKGIDARVYKADLCDAEALTKVIKEEICQEMPPIKGVFQCAATIKDSIFSNMTYSDWTEAIRPKTVGSDNLVRAISANSEDPFFIFLASSAGVIGSRGQANYAAGNCFEDALALNLRLEGKHAASIDLGPVLGAGMLADDEEILDILRASGFYGIRHEDFLTMITHAITAEISPGTPMPGRVIMGIGSGGLVRQNQPADPYWSRTALYSYLNLVDTSNPDLKVVDPSNDFDLKSLLSCCSGTDVAAEIVTTGLSIMLAKAMNMLPEEIDTGKPPNVYGVDSLVAVGVRNWVVTNCGVEVSVFEVLSERTVAELAREIARRGGFGDEDK
ncbi:Compactin diketide synthase mokB [Fusarium oxysporum f. sp. cepae]|uniref:Compactin diketide synthase mokB n=1 Tax=Fusarium oxysporum f. sp. cepae TaxID=396571 RepID=A0A3L6NF91_FUSOX|nr:Compactin diketide synthase mokB [Fusarium oxysporum f. sp. cepae]